MGFPSDQFGGQEAKSNEEVRDFVSKYGVEFPMMDRVDVNGANASPVFQLLKSSCEKCSDVRWNFATKWLVDRSGSAGLRFDKKDPMEIEEQIAAYLSQGEGKL